MDLVYSHFQSKPFAVPDFHTGDLTWKTIMSEWSNPSMSFEKTGSLCRKNRESSRNDEIVYEYVFEACRENYE